MERNIIRKIIGVAALCAMVIPFNASAGEYDKTGLYVGVSGGISSLSKGQAFIDKNVNSLIASGFTSATGSLSTRSGVYKTFAGYHINKNFDVEAFYAGIGSYDSIYTTTGPANSIQGTTKATAYGADLLSKLPYDGGAVYLRTGYYKSQIKDSGSANGVSLGSSNRSTSNFKLGFGTDYNITEDIALRVDYEYYHDKETPINIYSVGLVANF